MHSIDRFPGRPARTLARVLALGLLLSSSAHGLGVRWQQTSPEDTCSLPDQISCGALGNFGFFPEDEPPTQRPNNCPPLVGEGHDDDVRLYAPTPALSGSFPCHDGSCFSATPERSDILVLDWDNSHGRSVAGTIDHLADGALSIGLLGLDAPSPIELDYRGVGDVEVIAQLCRIAEMDAAERPLVVNMSFGRKSSFLLIETQDGPATLSQLLGQVLHHLRDDLGILLVAAAGNHGEMIFPASSSAVLSAGALDLSAMAHLGVVAPADQTADGANFLLPGYGLFINDGGQVWAAPPGSSYAAAFASAWLATSLLRSVDLGEEPIVITPNSRLVPRYSFLERYELELDGQPISGSGSANADTLLRGALGFLPELCTHNSDTPMVVHGVAVAEVVELDVVRTPDDFQDGGSSPNPDSEPCVPCHDLPGGPDGLLTLPSPKALTLLKADEDSIVRVDFSQSQGIEDEERLLGLYLRVDETLYRLAPVTRELLGDITDGHLDSLEITGLPTGAKDVQMSLVFHLEANIAGTNAKELEALRSVPVTVHGH